MVDAEFTGCFGLFRFLYRAIVLPIEESIFKGSLQTDEKVGFLDIRKTPSTLDVLFLNFEF